MKNEGKKIKRYLKFIPIVVFIILCIICGFLIQSRKIQKYKIQELNDQIKEMERKQVQVTAVKEEIKQISKYSAYEFDYTSIIRFSDKNSFMGIHIPLTGNSFIATIDGKMNIGINAENADISVSEDAEGNIKQVTLSLPHSEILDNYTIQESLEIFDEKNNIFNPVKVTDYTELIAEAEKEEEKKVLEGDLLQKSDEAVKYLLTAHLQAVYGDDVEIKYVYLDESDK